MPRRNKHFESDPTTSRFLYEFQSARWLYNEREQQACRYMEWDANALVDTACTILQAKECTTMEKMMEGSYNRAFLLAFDNGKDAVVRIPCPVAGPVGPITASEVATMQFTREVLEIPVPQVYGWNADPKNPVGSPYIIMENAHGISVDQRGPIEGAHAQPLFDDLMTIEKAFEKVRFSQLGSLYCTEDVSAELQTRPLFADDMDLSTEALRNAANKYRIGPLVDRQWYRGERATMVSVDRGPWPDFVSYCSAGINLELAWLEHPASKSQPFLRTAMQSPRLHRSVLNMCARVIPLVLPPEEYMAPTLWHPDFSSENVLISATDKAHVQAVIDWQHAMIAPYALQAGFPLVMTYDGDISEFTPGKLGLPEPPEDLNRRSKEEQAEVLERHRRAKRQKGYELYIKVYNPRRLAAISPPKTSALNILPYYISRSWSDGVGPITDILLRFHERWDSVVTVPGTPCPLDELTKGEIQEYRDVAEQSKRFSGALDALTDKLGSLGDGKVSIAGYEQAKKVCEKLRETWDEKRDGGPFPYQDGGFSFFLS
ncbi:hypothetical protein H0H93_003746 [Arthromyces matolae]|nr:hypothetical protein H0H93_003746 [Arthromyces matolae]